MLGLTLKKPSTMRRWLFVIATVALVAVAYVLGNGWWKNYQVRQELARLRAAGIPTTAEELEDYYAVPAGEPNATGAWMKPINAWQARAIGLRPYGFPCLDNTGVFPPSPGDDWPDLERAEAYLEKHDAFLKLIDAAIATPGNCCFIRDFSGDDIRLRHIFAYRPITNVLILRAFVRAHQGRGGAALEDVQGIVAATETLAREPIFITQLVRAWILRKAILCLERNLETNRYEDRDLAELQNTLEAVELLDGLRQAVIGQRVMGVEYLGDSVQGRLRGAWHGEHPLDVLRAINAIEEDLATDWPEPLALADDFPQDIHFGKIGKRTPWGQNEPAPTQIVDMIASRIERVAMFTARIRAATAGIAAVRFHDRRGHWPKSLDELVPEFIESVPLDPFTGEPLKFVVDGPGIRIYSVGRNRTDDGGVETPEETKDGDRLYKGEPDVVFSVRERPVASTRIENRIE